MVIYHYHASIMFFFKGRFAAIKLSLNLTSKWTPLKPNTVQYMSIVKLNAPKFQNKNHLVENWKPNK